MKLHEKYFLKTIAGSVAPAISRFIQVVGLSEFIRQAIAYLNYLLGRGAGTGLALQSEVEIAINCLQNQAPVVFDVGGNIGKWSKLYRERNASGTLYIFEPQSACQEAINAEQIPNSELVGAAVGREAGRLTLYSSAPTDGSASLHRREDTFFEKNTYSEKMVDVICLDDFIAERNIQFIDYIKFDIEGNEYEALMGLRGSLAGRKVGAFAFEFGSGNLNSRTTFRDFWNLLRRDYVFFIITPSGRLDAIPAYYEDMEFYRGVSNYVVKLKPQASSLSEPR